MSKNNSFSTMLAINYNDYTEDYNVLLVNNRSDKKKSKNVNDYSNEIKLQINNRTLQMRNRDSRYSLKNRRTVNKYWKDFNINQSIHTQEVCDCDWDYFEQVSSVQTSPVLSCVSSSFDIPCVEL